VLQKRLARALQFGNLTVKSGTDLELLALHWGDIDQDCTPPTLQVKRSLDETKAGLRLKDPKSDSGWRTITLPTPVF
jgi:hypothetical protein